jgi:TPR repeat protein
MKSFKQIENFVLGGNRPEPVDEIIPIKYKKIMEMAWDHDSYNRPEANEVYEKLSKCLNDDEVYPINDEPKNLTPVLDNGIDAQRDEIEMYEQALNYHNERNHKEAWLIFYELALSGHKYSLYYLGYYYECGYAVPKDDKKALKYYRESADKGYDRAAYCYAEACLKLAHEYMEKATRKRFKAGIKLAEYNFPPFPSRNKCEKLLNYLDYDEAKLQQSKESKLYQERIKCLRDKIKQKLTD